MQLGAENSAINSISSGVGEEDIIIQENIN